MQDKIKIDNSHWIKKSQVRLYWEYEKERKSLLGKLPFEDFLEYTIRDRLIEFQNPEENMIIKTTLIDDEQQ